MRVDKEEIIRFANIFDNAGQVFLAGMVVAPLISSVDPYKFAVVPFGLVFTFGCWYASWKLTRKLRPK